MGKKKNVDMSVDPEELQEAPKKKTQKKMVIWEDLYQDLSSRVASALREARVKPEQLVGMADGEITAIEGIGEAGLEEIRSKYASDTVIEQELKQEPEPQEEPVSKSSAQLPPNKRHLDRGGKAIQAARSKVDRTKLYLLEDAVKLVKSTNITKFDSTVTLHLNLGKDAPRRVELTFPFMAGAAKKVAIVSDALLQDIAKGQIDFDILLTTPAFMPKLAKYAKVLGPKGLMPSPKAGTITPDPEAKAKEFQAGKTMIKSEAKFPLMHIVVGKVGQKEDELVANIQSVLEAVKSKNIKKAVLSSTMSPGINIMLQ